MIDTVLSAPALSTSVLQHCKVFLFVTDDGPSDSCHGRIAGACVAQKIRWAMRIRETDENTGGDAENAVECEYVLLRLKEDVLTTAAPRLYTLF
jgi:hypothetical protein